MEAAANTRRLFGARGVGRQDVLFPGKADGPSVSDKDLEACAP